MSDQRQLVLATSNTGKLEEIRTLLSGLDLEILPQSGFGVPDVEESGLSFVENAIIKARNAAMYTGLSAIADDSGIVVKALGGRPGIYSARYAGPGATDEENLQKLIEEIRPLEVYQRSASFVCVMVFLAHRDDPTPVIAQGIWDGMLVTEPRGENGFGYDPIFFVQSHNCTSAELPPEVKNRLSHRGKALGKLLRKLEIIY